MKTILLVLYGVTTALWAGSLGICICVGGSVGLLVKATPDASPFFLPVWYYVTPCVCVVVGIILAQFLSRRLWHDN